MYFIGFFSPGRIKSRNLASPLSQRILLASTAVYMYSLIVTTLPLAYRSERRPKTADLWVWKWNDPGRTLPCSSYWRLWWPKPGAPSSGSPPEEGATRSRQTRWTGSRPSGQGFIFKRKNFRNLLSCSFKQYCASKGGYLVEINDKEEQASLLNKFMNFQDYATKNSHRTFSPASCLPKSTTGSVWRTGPRRARLCGRIARPGPGSRTGTLGSPMMNVT